MIEYIFMDIYSLCKYFKLFPENGHFKQTWL